MASTDDAVVVSYVGDDGERRYLSAVAGQVQFTKSRDEALQFVRHIDAERVFSALLNLGVIKSASVSVQYSKGGK